jgi:signal transduction histidine kinase
LAVYFSDVTQERLRDSQHRQTQRLESLGQITAGVAHDFNNLLCAISGFASLGQAELVDAEQSRFYFDQIDAATQKAVALTRQLLTFAREQTLSPALIDLNHAVEGLASLLRQLLPTGLELHLALSPQPVVVFADPCQLEQVLINLVVNSRDAMAAPGAITIATLAVEPTGVARGLPVPSGWLQVIDTGSGIPDDVLPHIFDPYFTTKLPEASTGLGLATIYGIVSQSDGAIFVDSTVGVGTTMTVALPRGPVAGSG